MIFLFKASKHIWQNLTAHGLRASDLINKTMKNQTIYCTGRHKSTELNQIKSCHGEHKKTWYREQDHELDDQRIRVQFPEEARDFSLLQSIPTGYRAHPASSSMGNRGSWSRNNATTAQSWPLMPTHCPGSHSMLLCFCSPKCLHSMLLNKSGTISLLCPSVTTANSSSHFHGHQRVSTCSSDKCYLSGTHPLTARVHKPQAPGHPGNWSSRGGTQHL